VVSRSFSQLLSPSQHQADKLTSLSSPVGPLYYIALKDVRKPKDFF
jgi:hypothetical protein